jgi:hypothetical protein
MKQLGDHTAPRATLFRGIARNSSMIDLFECTVLELSRYPLQIGIQFT